MTKNYIVKELINEMKERIPPGHNLANYLTDTLYMGKEAVYRRLRGEVAFTFDEIAVISHNLGYLYRSDYWKPLIQPGYF